MMQSLVRSMPDLHKTLILAKPTIMVVVCEDEDGGGGGDKNQKQVVMDMQELAFATEHAPFRHRKGRAQVGSQRKKIKVEAAAAAAAKTSATTNNASETVETISIGRNDSSGIRRAAKSHHGRNKNNG